jgi:gas vesicle protein
MNRLQCGEKQMTQGQVLLGVTTMADMKDRIKSGIDIAAERAKNTTDRFADAANGAKQEGQNVADRVKDGAQHLADRAGELGSQARDKVQEWAGEAGDAARQAGQKVQNWADEAYETAADKVGDFGKEVTMLIRNHPIPAVLIGLGIGVLLGRTRVI